MHLDQRAFNAQSHPGFLAASLPPVGDTGTQMAFNLHRDPARNLVVETRAGPAEVSAVAVIALILPDKEYVGFYQMPLAFHKWT